MSEDPKVNRRQRPVPRPAEPSAPTQGLPDKPAEAGGGTPAAPVVRIRTRPAPLATPSPPTPPIEPSSSTFQGEDEPGADVSSPASPAAPLPANSESAPVGPGDASHSASRRRTKRKEYEVGWKKPPKEHQFKSGNNANPRGRPKGSKNLATKIAEALNQKISVLRHGKPHKMAKDDVIVERLINKLVETIDSRLLKIVLDRLPPAPVSAPETPPDPREVASNEAMLKFIEALFRNGGSLLPPASEPRGDPSDDDDQEREAA